MTPTIAMKFPIDLMTLVELRYTMAYCDGEVRRCAENSATMDHFEKRRQEAEAELVKRKKT